MNISGSERENILEVYLTVDQVRSYLDGNDLPETLEQALDEAQGSVFSKERPRTHILIQIDQ